MLGTRHGHAVGKWLALCANPLVDAVGIYDPDPIQRDEFRSVKWFGSADELLGDPSVMAVAVEGRNHQSLAMAQAAVDSGRHIWYDKPAGDDWPAFQCLMQAATE